MVKASAETYPCPVCGESYKSESDAKLCASQPVRDNDIEVGDEVILDDPYVGSPVRGRITDKRIGHNVVVKIEAPEMNFVRDGLWGVFKMIGWKKVGT